MNKKPTNKVKKKYILLNGDLQTFSNVYPRDAAKKAASRGYTKIDLLEASKGIVHLFRGWRDRIEEDRSENHSENLWGVNLFPTCKSWNAAVRRLGPGESGRICSVRGKTRSVPRQAACKEQGAPKGVD